MACVGLRWSEFAKVVHNLAIEVGDRLTENLKLKALVWRALSVLAATAVSIFVGKSGQENWEAQRWPSKI